MVRDLLCIQFPGIVNNVDKMLTMIGGLEKLLKCYKSQGDRLELRFRPDDVYCRGVYGDKVIIDQVLVKVIKKTVTYSDGSNDVTYNAKVIGICRSCYTYTSLMDFQYLPMERVTSSLAESGDTEPPPTKKRKMKKKHPQVETSVESCSYRSIANEAIPNDPFDPSTNYEMNESAPLVILPAIFCRFDRPSINYDFKDNEHREGRLKDLSCELDSKAVIAKTRKSRALKGHVVSWTNEIPQEPNPDALEMLKNAFVDQSVVDRVKAQFEIRPLWSKAGLKYHSKTTDRELKVILPTLAYNVLDGPYRCMWIKFGYDTKAHPECAPFQSIDYRVKGKLHQRLDSACGFIEAKRSVYQYQLPLMKADPRGKRRFKKIRKEDDSQDDDSLKSTFIFRDGYMPLNRICMYQLIDIDLPLVKELISQKIPDNATCTEKDGWYPTGSIEKIRGAMDKILDKMMKERGSVQGEETLDVDVSQSMDRDEDEDPLDDH